MFRIKRIYETPGEDDGYRILIDRLWPRGFTKERAKVDLWLKEIAPSTELRKWYHHNPERWNEFKSRYQTELTDKRELILQIEHLEKVHGNITLLFAAKEKEQSQAAVLLNLLNETS
ncbi:MAG: DUF488 family protein [Proteiniphilum sp.]|jgi:uncharacterized protein YeaO (DUF488 family)|nr:DUF488 family protein [Proteiniphilum sp.]MDD3980523.1 DUF488 family protein [Proteiniphilum sp.]MDY0183586.1 DUF488 family protein [Proteiniphilum sp.]